ncbi:oligosaccharide biosynthesis protein Alg14-like protein [Syncephalis fuscata]|nr:oligosaccharide biosynthesis protein Alg14-like protein [Syncephalis fuscata]
MLSTAFSITAMVYYICTSGHTTEMLALLQALCLQRYTPRTYIITEGDTLSERRTIRWEANQPQTQTYTICSLPRARKVGQSFLTTPWSVIKSAIAAISIIWQQSPDLFICNGPGSCVPVCVIILIYRALGLSNTQIVYVESFARTQTLSLTGRILYLAVDCFVVQWPTLKDKYPRAIYSGVLV